MTTRRPVGGFLIVLLVAFGEANAQAITAAGQPAQLDVRGAGEHSIRVTLRPTNFATDLPENPAVAERAHGAPALTLREITRPARRRVGNLNVEVRGNPLTVTVTNTRGQPVQQLVFEADGSLAFSLSDAPVLGMGEGGPRPSRGTPWREQPVQFDRRGSLDTMEPRWQSDMYGSRNPAAMLLGTDGWGLFVAAPWVHVDLRNAKRGVFVPWKPAATGNTPQTQANQQQNQGKGIPPIAAIVPGLYDVFVFDAREPARSMKTSRRSPARRCCPPKWALGYMQSHRTLADETQLVGIVDTFREKRIPVDAVIYLGTGFCPKGWNTAAAFVRVQPRRVRARAGGGHRDLHARQREGASHVVPFGTATGCRRCRDVSAGAGPAARCVARDELLEVSRAVVRGAGSTPSGRTKGTGSTSTSGMKRHQFYYEGTLSSRPNVRPWSLQRNGHLGIAQWGGWVWSGDTETSWKTLEAQMAVGINDSLSMSPYWGSDIGGFYPNNELTGELYARWFQFGAFCPSFRSHGRTWWTRLPWGWGLSDMGPRENDNRNTPLPPEDRRNILQSELNNPAIEPMCGSATRSCATSSCRTRTRSPGKPATPGMPLMRAMWLHYPEDARARSIGDQYLWGRDLLMAPVYRKGATSRDVYLPAGDWYDWWTNARKRGGQVVTRDVELATMPIYVRAGAIVPVDPVRQYTSEPVSEPTTVRVYVGPTASSRSTRTMGPAWSTWPGAATWTRVTWNDRGRTLTIEPGAPRGATNVVSPREFSVVVLPEGTRRSVSYSGRTVRVTFQGPR